MDMIARKKLISFEKKKRPNTKSCNTDMKHKKLLSIADFNFSPCHEDNQQGNEENLKQRQEYPNH
jgi:hypothetical protein